MKRGWVSAWRAREIILVAATVLLVAGSAGAVNIRTGFELAEGYHLGKLTPEQPNPVGDFGWGMNTWVDLGGSMADPQGFVVTAPDAPQGTQYYQRLGGGGSNLALRQFPAITAQDGDFSLRWQIRLVTDQPKQPYVGNYATIEIDDTGPGGRVMTLRYDKSGNINLSGVQNNITKWDGTGDPLLAGALNRFMRGGLNVYWSTQQIEVFLESLAGQWKSIGVYSFRESTDRVDRIYLGNGPSGTAMQGVSWDDIMMTSELLSETAVTVGTPPYPMSDCITGMTWQWDTHKRAAGGSDNWPITWAEDDHQYAAWGDGWGFTGTGPKVSLGISRLVGDYDTFVGLDLWGIPTSGEGGKSYGIVSIGGVLYMWFGPGSNTTSYQWQRLKMSTDHGVTWTDAPWTFPKSTLLAMPTICNFGKDYAGARDEYVYSYFIRLQGDPGSLAVHRPGMIDLGRVHKNHIVEQTHHEFFAGFDAAGVPMWTASTDPAGRQPVFEDAEGVGWNLSVSYNAGLKRYILATEHTASFGAKVGFFEAPEPWGPWKTIEYYENWGTDSGISDVGRSFFWNFANKWLSADGKNFVCVFTGTGDMDSLNLVKGQFVTADAPYPPSPVINGVSLDWSTHRREAVGSDNWQLTWADDDHQYGAWGDGGGFGGTNSNGRVGLGFGRIEGDWDNYKGYNVWGGRNPENPAQFDGKSWGTICLDGILYSWVVPDVPDTGGPRDHYRYIQLAWSTDHAAHWTRADWRWWREDNLVIPTFLVNGKNNAGARDDYVYAYFIRPQDVNITHASFGLQVHRPGALFLARAPKDRIFAGRESYEWFTGISDSNATWGTLVDKKPEFENPEGTGWCLSACYNPGLGRYLLATEHTVSHASVMSLFDAPEPWGPWTTVKYWSTDDRFGQTRPGSSLDWAHNVFFFSFAPKWFSEDGRTFTLVFTGGGSGQNNDSLNTVRGTFELRSELPTRRP